MQKKKMSAEEVANLAQFVQVTRQAMEVRFGGLGLKLLELDLGISGNKNVLTLPGAERYFLKGSVLGKGVEVRDFRVDFAMSLGDTTRGSVEGVVEDVVKHIIAEFGK